MHRYIFALLCAAVSIVRADVYMHHPRGTNDRCDEVANDRNNGNRLFRSDNNAAGGYAWPDKALSYYTGTTLRIEWMSQHACGQGATSDPMLAHCEHVIQVGCQDTFQMFAGNQQSSYKLTDGVSIGRSCSDRPAQDGCLDTVGSTAAFHVFGNTCVQTAPLTYIPPGARSSYVECPSGFSANATCDALELSQDVGTFNGATCRCSLRKAQTYGYHEPENWYHVCRTRERNRGLFTADQHVSNNDGATVTRQEPSRERHGFECQEERDYWPYWHPTPWRDVAVLTSNTSLCEEYQRNSQNVATKCLCVASDVGELSVSDDALVSGRASAWESNHKAECETRGHVWKCFSSWNWEKPECLLAPYQTDNRLGNVDGRDMAHYDWVIPSALIPEGQTSVRCVLRLRYNISSVEVPRQLDALSNGILKNRPVRTYGSAYVPQSATQTVEETLPLRLAVQTDQYGRTFQDRSYVFVVKRRPSELESATIHNLGVRGKRGNIAQVRNCVEYDFVPNNMNVRVGDYVHVQWAGSDYNPKGNAGEGRAGTDRSNLVQVASPDANHFIPINASQSIFSKADTEALAWVGQDSYYCLSTQQMLTTSLNDGQNPLSCHFLNGARDSERVYLPTSSFQRLVQVVKEGTFHYISSRNNNFSNRSQKGTITATASELSAGAIAGIVVGTLAGVGILIGLLWVYYHNRIRSVRI
jgi:hypothetical protein